MDDINRFSHDGAYINFGHYNTIRPKNKFVSANILMKVRITR